LADPNFCLFFKEGKYVFGLIKDDQKNKWVVQPEAGKEFHLAKGQTALAWRGEPYSTPNDGIKILAHHKPQVLAQKSQFDLSSFHELLDKATPYPFEELADIFLDSLQDGWSQAALFLALREEPYLFHQKKADFFARTEEEIALLKHKESREAAQRELEEQERRWAKELLAGQLPAIPDPTIWDKFLTRIRNYLIYLGDHPEKDYFTQIFGLGPMGGVYTERPLLAALNLAGERLSWARLQILREISPGFSEEELVLSQALTQATRSQCPFDLPQVNLTALGGVSVDNATTQDYDDAISLRLENGHLKLWCHIADVASLLTPEHPLFSAAKDRASSLYTPLEKFPMLPPLLSEDFFSLKAGADRSAVTFYFEWNANFELVDQTIFRSLIHLEANWTYTELDYRLERGEEPYASLNRLTGKLFADRIERGALDLDRAEVRLLVKDLDHLEIDPDSRETAAHRLVQELAILINHQAAKTFMEAGRPALFRNQPPYQVTRPLEPGEKPGLGDLNILPAKLDLEASGHSALGLDCYLQCSSPIRRFTDLVSQYRLLELLAKQPSSLDENRLLQWGLDCEVKGKAFGFLERKLWDNLKLKYLSQNQQQAYRAVRSRTFRNGRIQVYLPELDLKLEQNLEEMEPGIEYQVKINEIDQKLQEVKLTICSAPS